MDVRFLCADVLKLPDLGSYDFVFDRGCYHVVRRDDVQSYQQTLKQISHPGTLGLVLAGNARERREPGPPVVEERTLRDELGAVFEIRWLREFRFDQGGDGTRFLGWSCFLRRPAGPD